jgi:dTDP-4-dehydrorhamnose reductase
MKVLVLGHTGMLGDAVQRFFKTQSYSVEILPSGVRWPSTEMEAIIQDSEAEWIVNCIGAIPQRKPQDFEYFELNTRLPLFLFALKSKKVIHAATDCEFSGKIPAEKYYKVSDKLDATDLYGLSKAIPAEYAIWAGLKHVKLIRTSIIGIENNSHFSLLNWFLNSAEQGSEVKGFTNHFWNGITTLEWARIAARIISGEYTGNLFQIASEKASKYELLKKMAAVFRPGYNIKEATHPKYQNKCLESSFDLRDQKKMLEELKAFYKM